MTFRLLLITDDMEGGGGDIEKKRLREIKERERK
jgi:hypothetical protein